MRHRGDEQASHRDQPHRRSRCSAVLRLDGTGWQIADDLVIPDTITLLPLSARAPELNPVENVWQYLRDNWLGDRIFASYDDIIDQCCKAWKMLVDQPWKIISIGLRDWAHQL